MKNYIDLEILNKVAVEINKLDRETVYVGGAIIAFYAIDPATPEPRPTQDIDIATSIRNYADWERIQDTLRTIQINPDIDRSQSSFKYGEILLDIIPLESTKFASTNSWFRPGLKSLQTVQLADTKVNILSAPYFLATKFEAFSDRGIEMRLSHDIEDIVYVIDNRETIVEEIKNSDIEVHDFLKSRLREIVEEPHSNEIVSAHLADEFRYETVVNRIRSIIDSKPGGE